MFFDFVNMVNVNEIVKFDDNLLKEVVLEPPSTPLGTLINVYEQIQAKAHTRYTCMYKYIFSRIVLPIM